jgi:Tfp pilus assembly PilM family ATPase
VADRAIRSTLSNLCSEIRRSIQFFEGQSHGLTVQRLVIGGGVAGFDGLPEYLHQELGLTVEIIDPLLRIPVVGNVNAEKLKECRNLLSVGIGLALRKVVD